MTTALERRVVFAFGDGALNQPAGGPVLSGCGAGWYYRWGGGLFGPYGDRLAADAAHSGTGGRCREIIAGLRPQMARNLTKRGE